MTEFQGFDPFLLSREMSFLFGLLKKKKEKKMSFFSFKKLETYSYVSLSFPLDFQLLTNSVPNFDMITHLHSNFPS